VGNAIGTEGGFFSWEDIHSPTLLENGYLTTINGDFSWFNNGLTMVKNGMIMGYTLWL
jgi:hypothetical protein